jgi:hypothetical protein
MGNFPLIFFERADNLLSITPKIMSRRSSNSLFINFSFSSLLENTDTETGEEDDVSEEGCCVVSWALVSVLSGRPAVAEGGAGDGTRRGETFDGDEEGGTRKGGGESA